MQGKEGVKVTIKVNECVLAKLALKGDPSRRALFFLQKRFKQPCSSKK